MAQVMRPPEEHGGGGAYTFASQPKAVKQRKKFRNAEEGDGEGCSSNIMWDRRVVRGNTYALKNLPATAQVDPIEIQRQQEAKRRAVARKRAREQLKPKSPEPVDGRQHNEVQTELYLEELSERIEEADVECQTDMFLDRPPSPLFIPAKSGEDVETQIFDGDLFDFDIEVKPILEVLIGKTVEQGLLEVMEEEELASLRQQQREFEELRAAELAEQQRLEEQERRHREEKQRRMKQMQDVLNKEKETAQKIAAKAFALSYLSDLVPSIYGTLNDAGYFYDPVERDIEQACLPWLMEQVSDRLVQEQQGRGFLDGLLRNVIEGREREFLQQIQMLTKAESRAPSVAPAGDTSPPPPAEASEPLNAENTGLSTTEQQPPAEDEAAAAQPPAEAAEDAPKEAEE